MPNRAEKSTTRLTLLVLVLVFASPATGKGVLSPGGELAVGLSSHQLAVTPSRPLPPLQSLLADESFETVFPLGMGFPLATWESEGTERVILTLSTNITIGDAPARVLRSEDIIASWESRALERWDALWALRFVDGIDGFSEGISGLEILDERTIGINLKPGSDPDDLRRSLVSPALRIATPPGFSNTSGTGPFIPDQSGTDRMRLTCALTHHAGRAYLDEVNLIAYESADISVIDFGRGNLDALLITSNERDRFAGSTRAAADRLEPVGKAILVLMLNPARLPFIDERRSLTMAVDREGIAGVTLGEGAHPAGDFLGDPTETRDWTDLSEQARELYRSVPNPREDLTLLVSDDPAVQAAAGKLRADWQLSFGVPVELRQSAGPPSLSLEADGILLALRLPRDAEGILPQCLALYDRSGWWEIAALALHSDGAALLRRVRTLDPAADLSELGEALESAGLVIPIAKYEILFAPGPDVSLVPPEIYPGPPFWRAFMGTLEEFELTPGSTEPEDAEE